VKNPVRDVDAYIAAAPSEARAMLDELRATIRAAAPAADEMISYQIPAYRLHGRPLVYFGAAKHHCALYGIPGSVRSAHADEIAKYDTAKGTIRFPLGKPVPVALVKKLVRGHVKEIAAAAAASHPRAGGLHSKTKATTRRKK
jgi:uncharacterized protein YdhG (YjbR/CyaY superfamily)